MNPGDKVKVKVGPRAGAVGVVIRKACDEEDTYYDVDIPKLQRYCLFTEDQIELVLPPTREQTIEEAARIALRVWCDFDPQSSHVANAMRALERALHSK